jgi:hypothetical protein
MNIEQFYKDCEFDIRIYKTKNMKNSKQIMTGNHKIGILTGVASLLQSCLDSKLMTPDELLETVNMVFEVRKTGARNKVIYNSFDKKGE